MCAHGPDSETHKRASAAKLEPQKVGEGSLAFVIETPFLLGLTEWAMKSSQKRQENYNEQTWLGLVPHDSIPDSARRISALLEPQEHEVSSMASGSDSKMDGASRVNGKYLF